MHQGSLEVRAQWQYQWYNISLNRRILPVFFYDLAFTEQRQHVLKENEKAMDDVFRITLGRYGL